MNEKTTANAAPWHEREWDLVIMGAGTTGLSAATFAGARNGRVLLVDASPDLGGTLLVAHGQISAAGTKLQKAKGIHDTPEMHYEEALRISKGTIDKDLARLAIFNAAEAFDWLCDNGYDLVDGVPSLSNAHEPYTVARYYWGKEWGRSISKVLIKKMEEQVARGTVDLHVRTIFDDDASGLLVLDPALVPGTPLTEALALDDTLVTLKITPNRADCLSIVGLAQEVASITGAPHPRRLAPMQLCPVQPARSGTRTGGP